MMNMSNSNIGLAAHCEKAFLERWAYIWSFYGLVATDERIDRALAHYPSQVGRYIDYIRKYCKGRRAVDCVGLIKSYLWWQGNGPVYDPTTDLNADMMHERAKEKGSISTIPEIPGICVWRRGHIGVYIGNGYVIEAKGTMYGVVKSRVNEGTWTHWHKCPFISYGKEEDKLFIDVDESRWSYREIKKAYDLGLIRGEGNGVFNPTGNLTREQAAVLMVRLYEKILKEEK
jgi:hypothetical protein